MDREGRGYTKYFKYSILQITDIKTDAEVVIGYESRWKDWLGTRLNGYNSN